MSEQKMPALPSPEYYGLLHGEPYWSRATVERLRAEAIEYGRQQERERLEPLRVAVEAFKNLPANAYPGHGLYEIANAARTLLEQTE